jgi:hypothetical protein
MADPSTIAAGGMAANVGGSLLGAFGANQAGQANSAMYQYQAGIALMNENIARQNASYATAVGEVEAQQSGMQTRAQIGQTKATQGASGLDVNKGSAVDVRASEADIGAENQAITRASAARAAYGYNVEAAQDQAQATVDQMQAKQAAEAGKISALGSLLGGASSVSSKWLSANSQGLFG